MKHQFSFLSMLMTAFMSMCFAGIVRAEEPQSAKLVIEEYDYGHTIAIRGGDTLANGDLVYDGDVLDFYLIPANPCLELEPMTEVLDYHVSLYPGEDEFWAPYPEGYELSVPTIKTTCPDSTSCVISWTLTCFDTHDVLVLDKLITPDELVGIKGVHRITGDSCYTATGLTPGNTYYIYVRAHDGKYGNSEWNMKKFTAAPSPEELEGDPDGEGVLHFDLHDSYGDGWNGAGIAVYSNGAYLTEVSISDGFHATVDVPTQGYVELVWHQGGYDEEVSFSVTNDAGTVLVQCLKKDAASFGPSMSLYDGYPFPKPCATIDVILAENHEDTYNVYWESTTASGIAIHLSQRADLTNEELDKLASSVPAGVNNITFPVEAARSYTFYYRALCPDNGQTKWHSMPFASEKIVTFATAPYTTIAPDTLVQGYFQEDAYRLSGDTYSLFYTFTLKEAASVQLKAGLENGVDPYIVLMDDSFHEISGTLAAGTYYVCVESEMSSSLCNYSVSLEIVREKEAPVKIQLPYHNTLSMLDAPLAFLEEGDTEAYYVKQYTLTVPDTMMVSFYVAPSGYSSPYYYDNTFCLVDADSTILYCGIGQLMKLEPNKDYRVLMYVNDRNVKLNVAIAEYKYEETAIQLDSLYTVHLSPATPLINTHGFANPGKLMSFTLEKETTISAFFTYPGDEEFVTMPPFAFFVATDSVLNHTEYSVSLPMTNTSGWRGTYGPGKYYVGLLTDGIHESDVRFVIRTSVDYVETAFAPADTLTIGKASTFEVGPAHAYSSYAWGGEVAIAKATLEQGKTYHFCGGDVEKRSSYYGLTILEEDITNPMVYSNTMMDNVGTYYNFTPSETKTYTFILHAGGATYTYDSLTYDVWMRIDTMPMSFLDFVAQADTIKTPYKQTVELSNKPHVNWSGEYTFMVPHSGRTALNEVVHYAHAVKAVVQPGDTLYAECIAEDFASLYIYAFEDSTYSYGHSIISSMAEAHEVASAYFVNELDTAQTVTVIGGYYEVDLLGQLPLILHVASTEKEMGLIAVTAKADKDVVYINNAENEAEAMEQLTALEISVLTADGATLTTVENNPSWWCIDWENGTASLELNDYDLPLGYSFYEFQYFVTVDVRVRQVVKATANLDVFTVKKLTEDAVLQALDEVVITVATSSNKTVRTFDKSASCWSKWVINLDDKTVSLKLTDSLLPEGYRFASGTATVTLSFEVQTGLEATESAVKAIKRLVNGQLVITTPDGAEYDATGHRIR